MKWFDKKYRQDSMAAVGVPDALHFAQAQAQAEMFLEQVKSRSPLMGDSGGVVLSIARNNAMRTQNNLDRFLSVTSKTNYAPDDLVGYVMEAGFRQIRSKRSNHWKYVHPGYSGFLTIKRGRKDADPANVREVRKAIELVLVVLAPAR